MKAFVFLIAILALGLRHTVAYELHEWGTFTTVSGSDGLLLAGLQREEENLPPFVHAHFGFENGQAFPSEKLNNIIKTHGFPNFSGGSKGLGQRPVSGVTVKMETPVIYFHSDKAFRAKVKVGFNGGTISQWYPARSGGETPPEPPPSADPKNKPVSAEQWRIDFSKPYQGGIEWDVDVLSPEESKAELTFKPRDSVNWLRARVPEANVVRTDSGETENYLFYRGLGNFKPGLHTSVSADDCLNLRNQTGHAIPYLLVFEQRGGKVTWTANPEGLAIGETLSLGKDRLAPVAEGFPREIYQSMKGGLVSCGLLESEADAMVQTWWNSYFESEGLRVFWILPDSVTDRILPLSVSPEPEKTIRVIVGRSEVFRPGEEDQWLALEREKDAESSPWKYTLASHRFGLAIQERVKALGKSTAAK